VEPNITLKIGFVGFGEAGYHIAKGLRGAGAASLFAYDLHAQTPGRGERIRGRAAESGTTLVDSPRQLAAACCVILSVVTASSAAEAAAQHRPFLEPHHFYADMNSVSPALKQAIGEEIAPSGARFVEAAILAPIYPLGHRAPMLINGPFEQAFLDVMAPFGMRLEPMSGQIGAAAAVKMCRSIMVKGLEALMLECMLGAARYGTQERVFASLAETFPGIDWNRLPWYMIGRVFEHGERRAREMEEVAETLRSAGIDPLMAEATARRQDWRRTVPASKSPAGAKELVALLSGLDSEK
jgi:3-hydroxyisobutyrate dehydrogenase